ncbi:KRAB-A domain-containing protein 2-like [Haliotis rubra]|uniref:KRAB-A domain-containing protein 2-like n=1 Tax=Haliotis rubra TaxID=36100 RepID=UPI001EE53031|nr:KRAB-A domain-containing protein 2-like [Haliotis rubra]
MDPNAEQREEFYGRLDKHIQTNISKLKRDKYVVTREMQDTALSLLKIKKGLKCKQGARMKFWVHEKFYPGPTGMELLCKKTHKPVVVKEDLFDVIHGYHCKIGHRKKEGTWKEVCARHSWVKRDIIDIYITTCKTCCGELSNNFIRTKPLTTDMVVASQGFMTRLALSVINMVDMPDGEYNYILVLRDCATKFATAWPIRNGDEIIGCLLQFFGQFGPPKFLHASETQVPNIAETLNELKLYWPNLIVLLGKTDHTAFIGVGERSCADLQSKLGAWMAQYEDDKVGWAKGLGVAIFQMNSAVSSESFRSPFQSVFGQTPSEPDMIWKTVACRGWTSETQIPEYMMKMFELKEAEKMSSANRQSGQNEQQKPGPVIASTVTLAGNQHPPVQSQTPQEEPVNTRHVPLKYADHVTPKYADHVTQQAGDPMTSEAEEDQVTPDCEIEIKIERADEDEIADDYGGGANDSPMFTYKY